ncbi:poly(A)-specific ribonuclease PARN-like isoform X2 [Zingiber officinale]|uniref:poly(A)-specific ribonuclease PARN-like isoform X2 n=1 Tax=Zingiber officinale TaxID=94328 RepID=UPI001C4BB65D|nr:poly(A)-specific ribonuclease PARN-like isoform X2 [Zingiber officinale]
MVVKKHFNDLMYVRVVDEDNSWQRRVVYVDTNEDKAVLMKDVLEDLRKNAEKRIKSSVGFRHVVDLLASTGKLIVGHNCLLDLAHIYNKFFGPLPSSLTEFVQAVHEKFPHIVDTKHLLNSNQTIQHLMKKNSKSLSSAFSLLCPNVSSNFQTTSKSYLRFEVQTDEIRIPRANVALATTTKSKYSLNKSGWFINLYKRNNLSHEIRRQGGQKEEIEGMHAISSRMEEQIIERKKNLLLHKV